MLCNYYVQCKTCSEIVRLRVQAGYYNWIPFTYECPKCKVVCRGEISIKSQVSPSEKDNQEVISNLKNCIYLEGHKVDTFSPETIVHLSSELYTNKLMHVEGRRKLVLPSPFMVYSMNDKNTIILEKTVEKILSSIYLKSEDYTAFWNLYEKSSPYLLKKKQAIGLKYNKKEKNENKKIGFIQDFLYKEIRQSDYYISYKKELMSRIRLVRKKKYKEFKKIAEFISNDFEILSEKLFTVTANFLNYYNYILPIILNEITGTYDIDGIKDIFGIAQTDFEFLKSAFSENYEDLKDFLWIVIMINNIFYRDCIYKFNDKFYLEFRKQEEVISKNIEFFNSQIKNVGNRVKILNYDPTSEIINQVFDNELRNSIDHRDYKYDYNSQIITYFNKGVRKEIYLIEFGNRLFQGFLFANMLWDILMYIAEEGNILR